MDDEIAKTQTIEYKYAPNSIKMHEEIIEALRKAGLGSFNYAIRSLASEELTQTPADPKLKD